MMRMLQWFFAICAFATCCDFRTYMEYDVTCSDGNVINVKHNASYPFTMGKGEQVMVNCSGKSFPMGPPGDFASDAQFFVFTGVVSFLATMAILAIYVFASNIYGSEDKKAPLVDFLFTVVIAVFWLSASAAWANGLSGMKNVLSGDWVFAADSICQKAKATGTFTNTSVKSCELKFAGSFGGANVSVIFGFLNFFLWSANLWFLYKETAWFAGRSQPQGGQPIDG